MKTSRADASRRSPVAFLANTCVAPLGADSVAIGLLLSAHQLAGLDAVPAQVDDDAVDDALRVGAPGVDAGRPSDLRDALRLVDVPVQRQQRLHAFDQLAH